jgi:hypothetical protein
LCQARRLSAAIRLVADRAEGEEIMMIDRVTAKSFVFRVLFSIGITAFVSLSSFLGFRWLLGS